VRQEVERSKKNINSFNRHVAQLELTQGQFVIDMNEYNFSTNANSVNF